MTLYYATRVVGTKSFSNSVKEMREGVETCWEANNTLKKYTKSEWIYDNASTLQLEIFLSSSQLPQN